MLKQKTLIPYPPPDFCKSKHNGDYPIRDVLKYVNCQDGQQTIVQCDSHTIFDPTNHKCTPIRYEHPGTLCKGRGIGNWSNPWSCSRYVSCDGKTTSGTMKHCEIGSFVYDPYENTCVPPSHYLCVPVSGKLLFLT